MIVFIVMLYNLFMCVVMFDCWQDWYNAHLENIFSMAPQSRGLMTPFFLLKHLNPPPVDLEWLFNKNRSKLSKRSRKSGPLEDWRGASWCHLMGLQLWLAAEYDVVESANSPTREQRRGVVSGMVTIIGLTLPGPTVNITYHKITGASQVLLPPKRSPATPAMVMGEMVHQHPTINIHTSQVSSSYTLLIRPVQYFKNCISKIYPGQQRYFASENNNIVISLWTKNVYNYNSIHTVDSWKYALQITMMQCRLSL